MNIVSVLQAHSDKDDRKSEVLLVRDDDGLFKVLKEKTFYSQFPGYLDEDVVMSLLQEFDFVPRFYGITEMENREYLRKSFVYGHPLSDYCFGNTLLPRQTALYVISDIAKKLKVIESKNILVLDLKPDNLILSNEIIFVDLGLCRYKDSDEPFHAIMSHPRFSAPEIFIKINSKSIIFQLGLIAHELLFGYSPMDKDADVTITDWNYCMVKYIHPLSRKINLDINDETIKKMLSYDTNERPSLDECIDSFIPTSKSFFIERKFKPNSKTILFPARMGIPHKGHVRYMSRLIDLGYKLIISIQRSYTLTNTDPIPKWLVAKMVAQSLFDMGYSEDSFSIYLTPFYENDVNTQMHFLNLPQKFNGIASSNYSIAYLFPTYNIIKQKDVLGFENEEYMDRSWGKILRGAVRKNDYETFIKYAASGVEEIQSFEDIQKYYPIKDNLFVYTSGSVKVILLQGDQVLLQKNVSRYLSPESCLDIAIKNKYSKCPTINIEGVSSEIEYVESVYGDKKLTIIYKIKS